MPRAVAYCVEELTPSVWRRTVAPRLAGDRAVGTEAAVHYVDATPGGLSAAAGEAERLEFRLLDIRDDVGDLLRIRIAFRDFFGVQDDIVSGPEFGEALGDPACVDRMPAFLAKRTAEFDTFSGSAVWRGMLLVQIAAWHARRSGARAVLVMSRKVWQDAISRYGERFGVEVVPVGRPRAGIKGLALSALGPQAGLFRAAYLRARAALERPPRPDASGAADARVIAPPRDGSPLACVEYYGHLNLDEPALHSDAFFWQMSELPAERMLMSFRIPNDPLDASKARELATHGMLGVATDPRAAALRGVPLFHHTRASLVPGPRVPGPGPERRWLRQQVAQYRAERAFWRDFFERYGVKAFVTWFKVGGSHVPLADAMDDVGGMTALYLRSFEDLPSPELAVYADVFFGFSPEQAEVERASGSSIRYLVATGYLGDHRFPLLRPAATELHARLKAAGAGYVVAFFDENSGPDERWHSGHEFMRVNYRFLLERLLADPTLGLVFKPKAPRTLRARLGDVAVLLERAEATGRCFVCEGGTLAGSYPPAFAALAADVAVHGHLAAATAGIEAALAGVPTLMMDREGWSVSRFHALGHGRVAFREWDEAWAAISAHRAGAGPEGFGDWGEELDRIDPFRDGRAAERMGTFLKWYLDAIAAGRDKDAALAECAERYASMWGDDKVTQVMSDYPRTPSARTGGVRL